MRTPNSLTRCGNGWGEAGGAGNQVQTQADAEETQIAAIRQGTVNFVPTQDSRRRTPPPSNDRPSSMPNCIHPFNEPRSCGGTTDIANRIDRSILRGSNHSMKKQKTHHEILMDVEVQHHEREQRQSP